MQYFGNPEVTCTVNPLVLLIPPSLQCHHPNKLKFVHKVHSEMMEDEITHRTKNNLYLKTLSESLQMRKIKDKDGITDNDTRTGNE